MDPKTGDAIRVHLRASVAIRSCSSPRSEPHALAGDEQGIRVRVELGSVVEDHRVIRAGFPDAKEQAARIPGNAAPWGTGCETCAPGAARAVDDAVVNDSGAENLQLQGRRPNSTTR